MAVYNFIQEISLGDVDPTFNERHYTGRFEPNILKRNLLHKIQERFCEIGFEYMIGNINGCFNLKTLSAIYSFQEQSLKTTRRIKNLYTDEFSLQTVPITFNGEVNGKFDEPTAKELNLWLKNNYYNSCDIPLVKFEKTWARPEIAQSLISAQNIVKSLGGVFPTNFIACFRNPANVTISTGMKQHSLHNTALAFDYDEWRGMQDVNFDYYFIESAIDTEYWNVFIKSNSNDIKISKHNFVFYDSLKKAYYESVVEDRFINLTEIFSHLDLHPIKRKKNWENEYYYTEWWHFQNIENMLDWQTEMNKIGYTNKFLKELNYI